MHNFIGRLTREAFQRSGQVWRVYADLWQMHHSWSAGWNVHLLRNLTSTFWCEMSCKHWRHGALVSSDLGFSLTAWVSVPVVNLESFEVCLNGQRTVYSGFCWNLGELNGRGAHSSGVFWRETPFCFITVQKSLAGRINLFWAIYIKQLWQKMLIVLYL